MFDERNAKQLLQNFEPNKMCIFAGAGIGIEATLPSWHDSLLQLKDYISEYDATIAQAMTERIKDGAFAEAADLYYMAYNANDEIKRKGIEKVFGKKPIINGNIKSLISLDASHYITTNYDSTIEDTWAELYSKSILSLCNSSHHFLVAQRQLNLNNKFVIHIHGAIPDPENIILCKAQYNKILDNDDEYNRYLRYIMMTQSILFVGFSFLDPAISLFLNNSKDKLSFASSRQSFAIIPDNNVDLKKHLQGVTNIIPIEYNAADDHKGLWECIKWVNKELRAKPPSSEVRIDEEEMKKIKYNLAAVYAHFKIKQKYATICDSIHTSFVHHIGSELEKKGILITHEIISEQLSQTLHISIKQSVELPLFFRTRL